MFKLQKSKSHISSNIYIITFGANFNTNKTVKQASIKTIIFKMYVLIRGNKNNLRRFKIILL